MLSERLRELRINMGLTQTEIAEKLGISRVNYNRYEKGERTPDDDLKRKLADFFNVSIDYLIGHKEGYDVHSLDSPPQSKKPKDLIKFLDQSEVMFDGIPLDDDDKERVKKSLEILFWDAKQKNKRKKS